MKELDDFTVERLQEIETRARVSIALLKGDEVAALARIALAAKEAGPVAFRVGERLFCSLYAAGGYASEMKLTIEPLYLEAMPNSPELPDGWKLVPIEPTESMVIDGFESAPDQFFSEEDEWDAYQEMSGCQQAAHRAKLCWAAMLAAAPKPEK